MTDLPDPSSQIDFCANSEAESSSLSLVFDRVHTSVPDYNEIMSGWQWDALRGKLLRAGFVPEKVPMYLLEELREPPHTNVIVGFGESVLAAMTGKRGIDKWNLSPLETKCGKKFIPTFGLDRVQKQYDLNLYQEMALRRAKEECGSRRYERPEERFLLNPPLEHTLSILSELLKKDEVACDVETGYGQINTVGFAWSPSDAIAINVLPGNYNDDDYYELWKRIGMVLESPSVGKVFQNYIYDTSYFSAYGIRTRNITHDTMHAMKVLWPEFKSNLGNVGRFYTKRPYWKDDGKVTDEEGAKKDWGNVRDWTRHYLYNCRDATGTFEAAVAQKQDLRDRGLSSFFRDYALRLTSPVREMCAGGMPLCLETKAKLKKETEETLERLTEAFQTATGSDLNPRSSKQVLGYLRENGVKIPKKYDKEKGSYRESADASSIKKIRLKQDLPGLAELQQIKSLDKALSAYIDFDVRPDGRLPYFLNITGTETLRFAGGKDGWERGFNIQTIPREGGDVSIKSMFKAPEGYSFIEVDLRQAESRFVAYDSADKSLIDMLESGADVHSHVGRAILRQMGKDPSVIPTDEFKSTWRQLGKKAGHGLNYYMKPRMFVETVFDELDMVISVKDAEAITQAYYGLFPGIPRWHAWIKHELYQKRKLSAPSGWERYFYGRWGDDMFKEAFAWRPQHTIPWIMNHLMLHLCEERKRGKLEFNLVYQGHDSLSLLSREGEVPKIAKTAASTWMWHPKVDLPGGRLCIPVEIKTGKCMADLAEFTS